VNSCLCDKVAVCDMIVALKLPDKIAGVTSVLVCVVTPLLGI